MPNYVTNIITAPCQVLASLLNDDEEIDFRSQVCSDVDPLTKGKWAAKWETSSQNICLDDGYVQFDTAWSCPVPLIEALSRLHPEVEIVVEYADQDIGSHCGRLTLKAGVILEHESAGKWSEMSEADQAKWTDFAYEVTGFERGDSDE